YEDAPQIDVSVLITDDAAIHALNLRYRSKDAPTDVLSFPLYDDDGNLDGEALGDIVISLERAQEQARLYGHTLERETAFLTAHAMLHLMGYDHEEDETEMFAKQEEILRGLHLPRE
ncbi:MAG: rRNA maturation RNase YbeY, partial [Clostridiales bacterium]|nr:rRNA maturation RNase YbeY [Clostridiales bacterium]